ncbi:MAG: cell division protein CrgA [Nitriliruptoraceae bacterium]
MPKSKHRRSGRKRPRRYETVEPERKPPPSPRWVPVTGASLLVAGVLIILLGYLPAFSALMRSWPLFGSNWGLIGGFAVIVAGFGFLTRWR